MRSVGSVSSIHKSLGLRHYLRVVVLQACNLNIQKAEAGRSAVQVVMAT